jgi:hypothetical protein
MTLTQDGIELPETKASFTAAGIALDSNGVVAQSEYTVARSFGAATKGWYAMAGYRLGKLVKEASAAAESLSDQTAQLTEALSVFRLEARAPAPALRMPYTTMS